MSWFSDWFGGLGSSASVADAAMGGTVDTGGFDVGSAGSAVPDLGQFQYDSVDPGVTEGFDGDSAFDGSSGADWAGSMGFGGSDTGARPSFFDPSSVGPPPTGGPSFAETGGFQIAPNQGVSATGSFGAGAEDLTGSPGDEAPATAWESKAGPWYGKVSSPAVPSAPQTDPEAFARQGTIPGESGGANVGSTRLAPPAPSFGDKLGMWASKTGTSLANAPGEAADTFARAPIATTAKLASVLGPLVIGGVQASRQADQARRAEQLYRRSLPGPLPVNPLPGTTSTGRADLPAASAMSPMLTNTGTGGFRVMPNVGLRSPQRLAEGGTVGQPAPIGSGPVSELADYGTGLRAGGPVGQPSPSLNASARVVMDYLARMLARSGH